MQSKAQTGGQVRSPCLKQLRDAGRTSKQPSSTTCEERKKTLNRTGVTRQELLETPPSNIKGARTSPWMTEEIKNLHVRTTKAPETRPSAIQSRQSADQEKIRQAQRGDGWKRSAKKLNVRCRTPNRCSGK